MKGVEQFSGNLKKVIAAAQLYKSEAAMAGAAVIQDEVRARAPVGETKQYRDSIIVKVVEETQSKVVVEIGGSRNLAHGFLSHILEFGTGPHPTIKPSKSKATQERYEAKLKQYHGNIPIHPGTKPRPHMRPGFEAARARATEETGKTWWARIVRAIA